MIATIPFACPRCHAPLKQTADEEMFCEVDHLRFNKMGGVWRFLLPERTAYFNKFVHEYETIRRAEGRFSQDPAYYRALPYHDLSGCLSADWHIRATSFDALIEKVIIPWEQAGTPLWVLDLGAGNGWLSNRLALRGHQVAAVDLATNDYDGLGCHRYYETIFAPVQAEFDRLPFPDGVINLAVYNASLHYSENVQGTIVEALRVLGKDGKIIILDTPVYKDPQSGEQMVKERQNQFTEKYGFPSDALQSQNYLSYRQLADLGETLRLDWRFITPFYGIRWMIRPLKAIIQRTREPAKFHLMIGTRKV